VFFLHPRVAESNVVPGNKKNRCHRIVTLGCDVAVVFLNAQSLRLPAQHLHTTRPAALLCKEQVLISSSPHWNLYTANRRWERDGDILFFFFLRHSLSPSPSPSPPSLPLCGAHVRHMHVDVCSCAWCIGACRSQRGGCRVSCPIAPQIVPLRQGLSPDLELG